MNPPEEKACLARAVIFKAVSQLGLVAVLTLPLSLCFLMAGHRCPLSLVLAILLLVSGLLVALRAWHIHLDATIFKAVGQGAFELHHSDKALHELFNKKIDESKALSTRFNNCRRLVRSFLLLLGMHLVILFALLVVDKL